MGESVRMACLALYGDAKGVSIDMDHGSVKSYMLVPKVYYDDDPLLYSKTP